MKNSEQDSFHALFIVEYHHSTGLSSDLSEGSLYQVGGAKLFPKFELSFLLFFLRKPLELIWRHLYIKENEQIIDGSLRALDSLWIQGPISMAKAPEGPGCLLTVSGMRDAIKISFNSNPFAFGNLIHYISGLMCPAMLTVYGCIDGLQGIRL